LANKVRNYPKQEDKALEDQALHLPEKVEDVEEAEVLEEQHL